MAKARSEQDRTVAVLAWVSVLFTGPVGPIVILALNWSDRGTLAFRQARLALVVLGLVVAVQAPAFVWAFVLGGPDVAYFAAWGASVLLFLVALTIGTARSARAEVPVPGVPG